MNKPISDMKLLRNRAMGRQGNFVCIRYEKWLKLPKSLSENLQLRVIMLLATHTSVVLMNHNLLSTYSA